MSNGVRVMMRKSALYGEGDAAKDFNKPPWMEIPMGKTWVVTKMLNKVTHMQKKQITVKLLHRQCFLCLCAQNWVNVGDGTCEYLRILSI